MAGRPQLRSVLAMTSLSRLSWPLVIGLGALALIRPLISIIEFQTRLDGGPIVPIALTIVISVVWILAVGLTRTPSPVVTLVMAGLVYGVLAIVVSAVLSPLLTGELQGPLTAPIGVVAVLVTNAAWGAAAGAIAWLLQRARSRRVVGGR